MLNLIYSKKVEFLKWTIMSRVNEIQVNYINKIKAKGSHKIKSSSDIAELLFETWNRNEIDYMNLLKLFY